VAIAHIQLFGLHIQMATICCCSFCSIS